ncbi:MAG: SulP family inorganic anion transporter [Acidobacteria bacterium]|nr:SulP family inorganic anion transporter [Acidobacteriota bacterium]
MKAVAARIRAYGWQGLSGDLFGGFLAALIALPYGMALARLMDLPPSLGVFTSILTAPVTALLGRNPVLIGGPSAVTVPFLAEAVRSQGVGGAAKVTIIAAVTMLVFSVLRLGRFAAKVPAMVMAGFSCGIGAMMIISQLRTMLGLSVKVTPDATMLAVLFRTIDGMPGVQWTSAAISLAVIAVSVTVAARWARLPAPLLGVVAAVLLVAASGWRVSEVGLIAARIPPFAGFSWTPQDVMTVLPSGIMLGFISSVNLLVTSRVVDHFRGRHKQHKAADADRELGAYGIGNLCAGMFGAPMSIGIPARSLANIRCGGATRLSNIVHAVVLLIAVEYLGLLVAHIPVAALAAVTAWTGLSLMGWSTWARLPKMRRVDAAGFLLTAFGVISTNAIAAVAMGCVAYGAHALWHLRPTQMETAEASR